MKINGEVQNTDFILDEATVSTPESELLSEIAELQEENLNLKHQLTELRRFAASVPGSPFGGH